MIGIYKITNKINGKIYIGQSMDIERRFAQHKRLIEEGDKGWYIEANETGIENFAFEVLQECPVEELNDMENYYIKKYKAIEFGYNSINASSSSSSVEIGVRNFINDKDIPTESEKITLSLPENLKLFKDLKYTKSLGSFDVTSQDSTTSGYFVNCFNSANFILFNFFCFFIMK